MKQVVLCNQVRTTIGTCNGSLKGIATADLGAAAIREAARHAGPAPAAVDRIVLGIREQRP